MALKTLPASSYSPAFHPEHNAEFLNPGEMLLHDVHVPNSFADNFHLPMSSLLASFIENHSPAERWRLWRLLDGLAAFLLVLALGRQLGGWPHAFAAAALMLAAPHLPTLPGNIRPPSWHGSFIYFHSFYFPLLATVAGLLVWRARKPTVARSAVVGLAVGATYLYRSTLVFFPPLLALFELMKDRRRWRNSAVLCVVPYLFLAPWIAMSWKVHHKFVPLEDGEANQNVVSGALGFVQKYDTGGDWTSTLPSSAVEGGTSSIYRWAAGEVLRHPLRYARGYLLRLRLAFQLHPVLLPLAIFAAFARRGRPEFVPLILLAVYYILIHCFMAVLPEYFEPLGPFLAALAAGLPPLPRKENPSALPLAVSLGLILLFSGFTLWRVCAYALTAGADPVRELDDAIAKNPADSWLSYERGLRRLRAGRLDDAVADMGRSLSLRPDYEQRAAVLAWARLLAGERGPFLAWHESHRPEAQTDAGFLKAHGYFLLGMTAEFDRQMTAMLPGPAAGCDYSAAFALEQSRSWLARRPVKERSRFLAECVKRAPSCGRLLLERAGLAQESGEKDAARRALRGALALPLSPEQRSRAAELSLALGDKSAAREALERARRLRPVEAPGSKAPAPSRPAAAPAEGPKPSGTEPLLTAARLSAKAGDRKAALSALQRAEALGPSPAQRQSIAALYQTLGEKTRALRILDELLKAAPDAEAAGERDRARLLNDRGVLEAMMGRSEAAIADLREAIRLDARPLSPYVTLGGLLLSSGKTEEARKLYDAALARTPAPEDQDLWRLLRADRDKLR